MFQRFKEASSSISNFVDQLAEEQNRLRAQQASQASPSSSSSANRRPNGRSRGSALSTQRTPRTSSQDTEKAVNLSGPDPDPATFEPDLEEKDTAKQDGLSFPPAEGVTNDDTGQVEKVADDGRGPADNVAAETEQKEAGGEGAAELPSDVHTKLRKLQKLESKYQELLKAYRRAHARNSLIEPFESRLRETTPLTSIGDPAAFVEYLNELSAKGGMVMDELKKVSGEKEDLRKKLDDAERQTKAAYDEVAQLRNEADEYKSKIAIGAQTPFPEASSSKMEESLPSSSEETAGMGEEMFSVDNEIPRLQSELQERNLTIAQLESKSEVLGHDVGVAKEAAEHMMADLESTRRDFEASQISHAEFKQEAIQKRGELEALIKILEEKLAESQKESESRQASLAQHNELGSTIKTLEAQLATSKNELLSMQASFTQLTQRSDQRRKELEDIVTDVRARAEIANGELNGLKSLKTETDAEYKQKFEEHERITTELRAELEKVNAELKSLLHVSEDGSNAKKSSTHNELSGQQIQVEDAIEDVAPAIEESAARKKKKNNKKKKKVAGSTPTETNISEPPNIAAANGEQTHSSAVSLTDSGDIQVRLAECIAQLNEKNATIERLEKKLREQDDLIEEIENLRDELVSVGQEHVEVKDKLGKIHIEKEALQNDIVDKERQIVELRDGQSRNEDKDRMITKLQEELSQGQTRVTELEGERAVLEEKIRSLESELEEQQKLQVSNLAVTEEAQQKLEADFEDLKIKSKAFQNDLSAAEQLAASRFKEMTNLRDMLQKAQPELTSLRNEVSTLRVAKEELATKSKELRRLELREESSRSEMEIIKADIASREQDVKNLNQRIGQETSQRLNLEEANRKAQRDLQRTQSERAEAITARDSLTKDLDQATRRVESSRARLEDLERQVGQLTHDTESLRDEISLKTAQHASAETLMTSVRDQAAEIATQLKESRERCESLEEELTDAHRLMSERSRESETMRRLLADVEGRAESRVKESRERMELAIQERDRAEDDANTIGRRKTRELDELKSRLRELERDLRIAVEDKTDLQKAEKDLRQQKAESERRSEQSGHELAEIRKAMSELRDSLDEGERQAREYDLEKSQLKRTLDDLQQQVDKLQKSNKTLSDELRSARATRLRPTDSPAQSARSSQESLRPSRLMSPSSPRTGASFSMGPPATIDYVYLKNVLLQFLEQKDKNHQKQLIPVLGMLLHFDRKDEQKWMSAIATR